MRYEVVIYGDERLREKAEPVAAVTGEIRSLAKDMLDAMYRSNGLGLAAEQVGRRESVCVFHIPTDPEGPPLPAKMPLVMINPRITHSEGEQVGQEGCLSFPEIFVNVKRFERVTAAYMDLEGKELSVTAGGLLSRAIQHELDHLNGILLVDRMSVVQKVAVAGKLKRLKRSH